MSGRLFPSGKKPFVFRAKMFFLVFRRPMSRLKPTMTKPGVLHS